MGLAQASPTMVRFGVFEADFRAGELRRNGIKVRIQDLPFRALAVLLSHPHQVVTREELRQALWPDGVFVDFDRGISSAIKRLRDALGDSADNPLFIETMERHGYRWIGPISGEISGRMQDPEISAEAELHSDRVSGRDPAAPPRLHASWRWKFIYALPVLAVLFALWISRSSDRSAKAGGKSQPISAASSANLPLHAANREAEEFYLKGRYYWEKRTPDNLNKAVDSFTQALIHDPGYAPAYVGLADCYNLLREYTVMPASEAYPRAFAAAKKAVELDPQSSDAHASLAFVSFFGMWDSGTADREFRRALELNPSNAIAHHWYATYLQCLRRYPESLAEIERAQALEPASKSVLADKGNILFNAGRRREAIALLKQMEENEPDFISPHRYLKEIYLLTAGYPHYLVEARSEAVLMHDSSALAVVEATENGFAAGGGKGLLETLRQQQTKLYERGLLSPYFLAVTCSLQGDKQEALRYLKTVYEQHADGMAPIETDHAFDNLHDEPAFQQLVAEVGLPPLS